MANNVCIVTDSTTNQDNVLDYLAKIKPAGAAFHAVMFNMSKLLPFNREPKKIQAALDEVQRTFAPIQAKIYKLLNHNIICFVEKQPLLAIERSISQFKRTLPMDPILSDALKKDAFCQIYDLGFKWRELDEVLQDIENDPLFKIQKHDADGNKINMIDKGIDSETLNNLDKIISTSDLRPYLKRQSIFWYDGKEKPHKIASHLFLSVQKLQEKLAINEPIMANIWLFKHLTTVLDRQTLLIMRDLLSTNSIESLHVNINLRTIISSSFYRFFDTYEKQKPLSFCVDIVDYIAHPDAMIFARDLLRQKECRLILSGLTAEHLKTLNFNELPASLFKLKWSSGIIENKSLIKELVDQFGAYKFILHQCSTEREILAGLECGIEQFQGYGIEKLLESKNMI